MKKMSKIARKGLVAKVMQLLSSTRLSSQAKANVLSAMINVAATDVMFCIVAVFLVVSPCLGYLVYLLCHNGSIAMLSYFAASMSLGLFAGALPCFFEEVCHDLADKGVLSRLGSMMYHQGFALADFDLASQPKRFMFYHSKTLQQMRDQAGYEGAYFRLDDGSVGIYSVKAAITESNDLLPGDLSFIGFGVEISRKEYLAECADRFQFAVSHLAGGR